MGDYTYCDDADNPTGFEQNNVLFNYPEFGDRLVIGTFRSIGLGEGICRRKLLPQPREKSDSRTNSKGPRTLSRGLSCVRFRCALSRLRLNYAAWARAASSFAKNSLKMAWASSPMMTSSAAPASLMNSSPSSSLMPAYTA